MTLEAAAPPVPDIPDASRTCRTCQQPTPPDEQEFLYSAGIQCVCLWCVAKWPDAPAELKERARAREAEAAQPQTAA